MVTLHYVINYDIFNSHYVSTLLGGEFDNCHGYGRTENEAIRVLKIRVYQLRNKNL